LRSRKLSDALHSLIKAGLRVSSFQEAQKRLLEIDRTSPTIRATLTQVIQEQEGDPSLLDLALKEYYENISPGMIISPLPGAIDLLQWVSTRHLIALVSVGIPSQQIEKAKQAGIDLSLFDFVEFLSSPNKQPIYEKLIVQAGMPVDQVIVCGDKVQVDLVPAKAAGCTTVRILHGRENGEKLSPFFADYTIKTLFDLKPIITALEARFGSAEVD
jgi:FMN phosphatase YigB (HAD superfamily)